MPFETRYRLTDRIGGTEGPYVGPEGAYIGPGFQLFRRSSSGNWTARPFDELRPIFELVYGAKFSVEHSIPALQASAAALSAGEDIIAKIALLRARLPAISPESSDLLKYFFDPSRHPRWPAGDPAHHGGEFRPVSADEGDAVPPLGRPRRRRDEEVEPAPMLPDLLPTDVPNTEGPTDATVGADANTETEPDSPDAEEASLPGDEKERRRAVRSLLYAFVSENIDLFRQDPKIARQQFEAANNIPDSIRNLSEYQSFWLMPESYDAARVSSRYIQFDNMTQFANSLGYAPSGWQYHHIVNQNPDNQANDDMNWRLHTTENVVLIPTWWHFRTFGPYNSKFNPEMTVRQWQATKSYEEQFSYGIGLLWRNKR